MSRCGSCDLYGGDESENFGVSCPGNECVEECAKNLQYLINELRLELKKAKIFWIPIRYIDGHLMSSSDLFPPEGEYVWWQDYTGNISKRRVRYGKDGRPDTFFSPWGGKEGTIIAWGPDN